MIVLLLAACTPSDPSLGDKPDTETDTGTVVDTETTDTDTGTAGTPPAYCVTEQDVTSGILWSAWRSPTGTLYAVGASTSARVRAPDGTWTLDPSDPEVSWEYPIDGADDGEVWALSSEARRREADGSWTDMGAPAGTYDLRGLRVFGADDVLVLRVDDYTPALLWWDGATWTEDVLPEEVDVDGMVVLPDRTIIFVAEGGLHTVDPVRAAIVTPPELDIIGAVSAPDGTLVALGWQGIAIGTVAGGLTMVDPGVTVDEWSHAWAGSANDVWITGQWWEQGVLPHAVIAHWDGAGWTTVVEDWPGEMFRLAGGDGQLFAIGGYEHELVLVGDETGLVIDRETWGPGYLNELAVDDVTGNVWSIGYSPVLGVYEGGVWRGEPLPDGTIDPDRLAASGGRVVLFDSGEGLHVYEAGALVTTPTPDWFYYWLAAADGVLFAAGTPYGGEDEQTVTSGISVVQDAGTGWQPIDTTGLPDGAEPGAIWADGATDLWLGLELGESGGLAHWDGAGWTVLVDDLPVAPDWLKRMADGQLYFNQFSDAGMGDQSVWIYDGAVAFSVFDMPPDVRAAHLLPDGTWFTSVIARGQGDDEDLYGALLQKDPGGDWVEVFTTDYGIALVGAGDTVWAEQDELSWTRAPCER